MSGRGRTSRPTRTTTAAPGPDAGGPRRGEG